MRRADENQVAANGSDKQASATSFTITSSAYPL
jgi:hypothetical protein